MNKDSRIYVAGATGLAGSAIYRELVSKGYTNIITKRVDLRQIADTFILFVLEEPEYVFLSAAHAGGIKEAIDNPVEMLSDNLLIQTNVINHCHEFGVKKLIFLGSSCIYPVDATQPYKECDLGKGRTDENWSYAVAKLAGVELCRAYNKQYGSNFMSVMPCNLYGYNDNFDLDKAHVIPALMRKFIENETVEVWGSRGGYFKTPRREFLFSDDFAKACVMLMESRDYSDLHDGIVNIGSGYDVEIDNIIHHLNRIVGKREIIYNDKQPGGIESKLLDINLIKSLGWKPETELYEGIEKVYADYCTCGKSGKDR